MERGAFDLWYATKMPGLWPFDYYKVGVFCAKEIQAFGVENKVKGFSGEGFCTNRSDGTGKILDCWYATNKLFLWNS